MTLKTSSKAPAADKAPKKNDAAGDTSAKSEAKTLVLAQYNRFGYKGRTYSKENGYQFSPEEQAEMLALRTDTGGVVFIEAKEDVPVVAVDGASGEGGATAVTTTGGRIEIGSEDELKELGLNGDKGGAGAEGDQGAANAGTGVTI